MTGLDEALAIAGGWLLVDVLIIYALARRGFRDR